MHLHFYNNDNSEHGHTNIHIHVQVILDDNHNNPAVQWACGPSAVH